MVKDVSILSIGVKDFKMNDKDVEIEYVDTLEDAISTVKTKFYDSVIVNFKLPDGEGATITNFYPHYRTIVYLDKKSKKEDLSKFRNGFYAIINNVKDIKKHIDDILTKYPKKEQDTLIALMTIQGSIDLLTKSQDFIRNSFSTIHNRLKSLEDSQKILNDNKNLKKSENPMFKYFWKRGKGIK